MPAGQVPLPMDTVDRTPDVATTSPRSGVRRQLWLPSWRTPLYQIRGSGGAKMERPWTRDRQPPATSPVVGFKDPDLRRRDTGLDGTLELGGPRGPWARTESGLGQDLRSTKMVLSGIMMVWL